ncbi:MAG: DUF2461 domain-containing protein [Chlorobi bacterium]|nr:DUF2461 domain-containing protein [Chlorobiota bacterium]
MKKKEIVFPQTTLKYLRRLKKNNTREWFAKHREDYETDFLLPAQIFVEEIGYELSKFAPSFHAVPQIDKSIFRIYRDTRFSKDKAPYKTHLGIFFWEGTRKKMECSGMYFHLEPNESLVAVGMHVFPPDILKKYREAVSNPDYAKELTGILKKIERKRNYKLSTPHYKRVPKGFDKEYKYAGLLLNNGIYAYQEIGDKEFDEKSAVKITMKVFKDLRPLHDWLYDNLF